MKTEETKQYNGVMSLAISINCSHPEGEDITAAQIRKAFNKKLNELSDEELKAVVGFDDVIEEHLPENFETSSNITTIVAESGMGKTHIAKEIMKWGEQPNNKVK